MNLIKESFTRIFPEKDFPYTPELEYNRRLSPFNANISLHHTKIKVNLNLQWKSIDDEIKIGLIQHLLLKIFKNKNLTTTNIDLYTNFTKNIPLLTQITKNDPMLEASYKRVNTQFFDNLMKQPNLMWGRDSRRKLACYNLHSDTVSVSTIFKEAPTHILDYLMYHELLHKHFQFEQKNRRSQYHTPEFRTAERMYPNLKKVEKEIDMIIRQTKKKQIIKPVTSKKRRLLKWFPKHKFK